MITNIISFSFENTCKLLFLVILENFIEKLCTTEFQYKYQIKTIPSLTLQDK